MSQHPLLRGLCLCREDKAEQNHTGIAQVKDEEIQVWVEVWCLVRKGSYVNYPTTLSGCTGESQIQQVGSVLGIMLFTPQKPIAINENSWRARTVCGSIFPTRRELRERNIFSAVRLSVRFLKNFQAKIHKTWWTGRPERKEYIQSRCRSQSLSLVQHHL